MEPIMFGGWAIAQSPILGTTITMDRPKKSGYVPMLEIYKSISPQLYEPLITKPLRALVWEVYWRSFYRKPSTRLQHAIYSFLTMVLSFSPKTKY
jgi:hypothetical protein